MKETEFQELREMINKTMGEQQGNGMKGPEFQEHSIAILSLVFSLAENRKDPLVLVLISTVVKFPLITHTEVFPPCL